MISPEQYLVDYLTEVVNGPRDNFFVKHDTIVDEIDKRICKVLGTKLSPFDIALSALDKVVVIYPLGTRRWPKFSEMELRFYSQKTYDIKAILTKAEDFSFVTITDKDRNPARLIREGMLWLLLKHIESRRLHL